MIDVFCMHIEGIHQVVIGEGELSMGKESWARGRRVEHGEGESSTGKES
jgi:hypothetical protein